MKSRVTIIILPVRGCHMINSSVNNPLKSLKVRKHVKIAVEKINYSRIFRSFPESLGAGYELQTVTCEKWASYSCVVEDNLKFVGQNRRRKKKRMKEASMC